MTYLASQVMWVHQRVDGRLTDGDIWLGYIDAAAAEAVRQQHAGVLLECYIDPSHLIAIARANGASPGQHLREQVLPDLPHMKSGDFGEILARSLLQGWRDRPRFPAFRWRNRAHKNDTVRGPDLLGYVLHRQDGTFSEDDVLVLCEVKTRSSSVDENVVMKAYDDALKHFVSRLTNSLFFIQQWLHDHGLPEEAEKFARFTNPHKAGFRKRIVPLVVHNSETWEDRLLEVLPERHALDLSVEVVVLRVEKLSEWIEAVREAAVEIAGE